MAMRPSTRAEELDYLDSVKNSTRNKIHHQKKVLFLAVDGLFVFSSLTTSHTGENVSGFCFSFEVLIFTENFVFCGTEKL